VRVRRGSAIRVRSVDGEAAARDPRVPRSRNSGRHIAVATTTESKAINVTFRIKVGVFMQPPYARKVRERQADRHGLVSIRIARADPDLRHVARVWIAVFGRHPRFRRDRPGRCGRSGWGDINVNASVVLSNSAVVQLDTSDSRVGDVDLFNAAGSVNAVIDIEGWFH
jgi:hypothetical protein